MFALIFYRFGFVFGSHHVGHFFAHKGEEFPVHPVFCWVYVLFRFFGRPGPVLAPFGLDLGSSGVDFGRFLGSILEGFWARFWEVLGFVLEASGDNLGIRLLLENLLFQSILLASGSGWAGGVTRSAKNLIEFSMVFFSRSSFDLGSILVPTCFHFFTKNPPKSQRKSIPKALKIRLIFDLIFH